MLLAAACGSTSAATRQTTEVSPAFLWHDTVLSNSFYNWDGKLIRRFEGSAQASPDGRYYTSGRAGSVEIRKQDGTLTASIGNWSSGLQWAGDGNVLCGTADGRPGTSALVVMDAEGHIHRIDPGLSSQFQLYACSVASDRAAVLLQDQTYFVVLSLIDGHVEAKVALRWQSAGYIFSPDARWLAEPAILADGKTEGTDIIDVSDGTIRTEYPAVVPVGFMPDSRYLLINDEKKNQTAMIDWTTGQAVWNTTGYLEWIFISDPATDKMLALVMPDGRAGQSRTTLILSASGEVTRFVPVTP